MVCRIVSKAAEIDSGEGSPPHVDSGIKLLLIYCFAVLFLHAHFYQYMLSNIRCTPQREDALDAFHVFGQFTIPWFFQHAAISQTPSASDFQQIPAFSETLTCLVIDIF